MRYAAIDVGSNAVRLLIADIIQTSQGYEFKKNTLVRVPVRLGDDAFLDHKISPKKADDLVDTMKAFSSLMKVFKVSDYMACATSAMREAQNSADILKRIQDEAQVNLKIVHGQDEAKIIYANHIEEKLDKNKNYLYIDVGGGSTELSVFIQNELVDSKSFNLGTIRILDNQDTEETWNDMRNWVKNNTKGLKNLNGIGTGGNINKLYRLSEVKEDAPMSTAKLVDLYKYLSSYSLKDRINILGLKQDRADVIIPACEIYLTVLKVAGIKQIFVPRVGMADGIINVLIEKNLG